MSDGITALKDLGNKLGHTMGPLMVCPSPPGRVMFKTTCTKCGESYCIVKNLSDEMCSVSTAVSTCRRVGK